MKTRQYFFYFALTASTCIHTSCSDENLSVPAHDGQPVEIRADMSVKSKFSYDFFQKTFFNGQALPIYYFNTCTYRVCLYLTHCLDP